MGFWIGIGAVVGALLGGMGGGLVAAVVLAAIGAAIGAMIGRAVATSPPRGEPASQPPPPPHYGTQPSGSNEERPIIASGRPTPAPPPTLGSELIRRLDALDARLARIEARLEARVPHAMGRDNATEVAAESASPARSPSMDPQASMRAAAARDVAHVPVEPPGERAPMAPAATSATPVGITSSAPTMSAASACTVPVVEPPPKTGVDATTARDAASTQLAAPDGFESVFARGADGTLQPATASERAAAGEPLSASRSSRDAAGDRAASASGIDAPPPRPAYAETNEPASAEPSLLWRWLTGGNAVTRIGIVILFFGVAFLLTYFAEVVSVPIGLKLAGAGAGGLALAVLGVVLAHRRPAYGLSLQGAGMGVVYLVVFAAFRLYEVLGPATSIALLVLIAVTTVALALRHDSQPLAGLALAGGFLAPVLIRSEVTDPALLFGYFAILNAAIFAIAWRRAWRPLNVLGFAFTFVLGLVWGHRFYTPAHYATVQPFLALFFLFYVAIAILYARRSPLDARSPVDGVLVFGVPIAGFALQMAIVRGYRYGVAISAGGLAVFYAILWAWLRTRSEPGTKLLARSFIVLGTSFATLAIPFAADPRATSAWWAIEAAAVFWIGAVQRQPLARAFALALQAAAAIAFVVDVDPVAVRPMLNAHFLGAALIGVAALATAWTADRYAEAIGARERLLVPWIFVWGAAWWMLGGVDEMHRHVAAPAHVDAALAWVGLSTAIALAVARMLDWPRLRWLGAVLLPAMLLAAVRDLDTERTTLTGYGWLVWPLAWGLQFAVLRAADTLAVRERDGVGADAIALAHTTVAIALVAWCSWEASEWVGRATDEGSVWIACAAALPGVAYLAVVLLVRGTSRWPWAAHGDAYARNAGTAIASLIVVWFGLVNVLSSGDARPLPYVPVANPLDLTLVAVLYVLARWSASFTQLDERTRLGWLGVGAFIALNGTVVRAAHHWGDVPWRLAALAAYKPLQAALTLTWTATALAVMVWATRQSVRAAWMIGGALLAAAVVKLFVLDLAALSGLTRVVAFMGVGALLLVIGYVAPIPPASADSAGRPREPEQA